jgi:hypothetical protein
MLTLIIGDAPERLIHNFIQEFKQGMDVMQQTMTNDIGDGWGSLTGKPMVYTCIDSTPPYIRHWFNQAITHISSGLLRDPRVFYMDDSQNWIKAYDRQGTWSSTMAMPRTNPRPSHSGKWYL